ncbi:hypothetical protein M0813_00529 [Anaeramoeba flamelloides]|uniref:Uncharacterized protein n=1 Tax=Anaeramoeba flamelloides TaxID=1746091 RepID=A0ABQ8YB54_9EUKA|nr:hypothetical protein M0813_00529 [Anaeramoeba flamelloides]
MSLKAGKEKINIFPNKKQFEEKRLYNNLTTILDVNTVQLENQNDQIQDLFCKITKKLRKRKRNFSITHQATINNFANAKIKTISKLDFNSDNQNIMTKSSNGDPNLNTFPVAHLKKQNIFHCDFDHHNFNKKRILNQYRFTVNDLKKQDPKENLRQNQKKKVHSLGVSIKNNNEKEIGVNTIRKNENLRLFPNIDLHYLLPDKQREKITRIKTNSQYINDLQNQLKFNVNSENVKLKKSNFNKMYFLNSKLRDQKNQLRKEQVSLKNELTELYKRFFLLQSYRQIIQMPIINTSIGHQPILSQGTLSVGRNLELLSRESERIIEKNFEDDLRSKKTPSTRDGTSFQNKQRNHKTKELYYKLSFAKKFKPDFVHKIPPFWIKSLLLEYNLLQKITYENLGLELFSCRYSNTQLNHKGTNLPNRKKYKTFRFIREIQRNDSDLKVENLQDIRNKNNANDEQILCNLIEVFDN